MPLNVWNFPLPKELRPLPSRDGEPLAKDCCRLKDQVWFLHRLNHSVLEKQTRSSIEALNPLLMATEHTTSLLECCGARHDYVAELELYLLQRSSRFPAGIHHDASSSASPSSALSQLSACLRRYSGDSPGQGDSGGVHNFTSAKCMQSESPYSPSSVPSLVSQLQVLKAGIIVDGGAIKE